MESVREFDRLLKEKEADNFLLYKIITIIVCIPGGIFMFIPFETKEFVQLVFFPVLMFGMALVFYVTPYLYISKEASSKMSSGVNVYQLCRYLPVSYKDIYRVRLGYVNRFCCRIFVISMVSQNVIAYSLNIWDIWKILYPVFVTGLVWLFGTLVLREKIR